MPAQSCTWRRSSSVLAWYPCTGCSASRLSKTRSGTVSSRFLAGMVGLALAAPVPPLALLCGKKRIAGLGNGGGKDILAADVHALAGDLEKLLVETFWILAGKLLHAANAKQLKVAQHGWPDGDQIL